MSTKNNLNPIQIKLLEMLKWFHDYCEKNHYTYYVVGGTLLGAVRHKGFIPWDDDIDVAMPRSDYNRIMESFSDSNGKYKLETPYSGTIDFLYSFSKLYDTTTTLIEKTNKQCIRGVYIDVFPLDGIGDTIKESKKNYRLFDFYNMLLMSRTLVADDRFSKKKKMVLRIASSIPEFIINNKKLSIKLDKIAQSYSFETCKYVGNLMGAYRFKEVFCKDYIGNATLYQFEDCYVYGFEYYDEYLSHIYGTWNQLPPENKRKGAHDYQKIDLNTPYLS